MEIEMNEIRRQAIDWEGIQKTLHKDKKPKERDKRWYNILTGNIAYDKLL